MTTVSIRSFFLESKFVMLSKQRTRDQFDSISMVVNTIAELKYADATVLLSHTRTGLEQLIPDMTRHIEDKPMLANLKGGTIIM